MRMAACNDPWMRAIVLSPVRTPSLRTYVRTEYGGCSDWVFADLASAGRKRRQPFFFRRLRNVLDLLRGTAHAAAAPDQVQV